MDGEATLAGGGRAADVGQLELLAPAGDPASLVAALESGADAVYLGMKTLNARRRAANFGVDQFRAALAEVRSRGKKAYLTLNIDVAEREVGLAARILALAAELGVDAVLVRDPAVLAMVRELPSLAVHFSTQAAICNSADVAAAQSLNVARVVLARELTLREIAAASKGPVETEVFVQGALCFCVSGRCLLSSWVGGRSGNRGACTSPCRVPWSGARNGSSPLFSMHDLCGVHRLDELAACGVRALKIEGRLKNAEWVRRAVSLYREAIDSPNGDPERWRSAAEQLTAYAGRQTTCGYWDGERNALTGTAAGRGRGAARSDSAGSSNTDDSSVAADFDQSQPNGDQSRQDDLSQQDDRAADDGEGLPQYDFEVRVEPHAIACRLVCLGQTASWTLPKTVVRRPHKAVAIGSMFERLEAAPLAGFELGLGETNDPDYLLVPRAYNALLDTVAAHLRRAAKGPSDQVRHPLPQGLQALLEKREPHTLNRLHLGDRPTRVRLSQEQAAEFLSRVSIGEAVVEGLSVESLRRVLGAAGSTTVIVALPPVFFEADIAGIERLLSACARTGVTVEVNSWGGWHLARKARLRIEAGPGLAVLNSLAAQELARLGMRQVTLSPEASRRQWEELTACCPVPCSLTVFGRPPLMISRVALPEDQLRGAILEDRRGVQLRARKESGLWVFRPESPFDLRNVENERIRVRHLVVDLVGSPDPLSDWYDVPLPGWERFRFNYDRSLA